MFRQRRCQRWRSENQRRVLVIITFCISTYQKKWGMVIEIEINTLQNWFSVACARVCLSVCTTNENFYYAKCFILVSNFWSFVFLLRLTDALNRVFCLTFIIHMQLVNLSLKRQFYKNCRFQLKFSWIV